MLAVFRAQHVVLNNNSHGLLPPGGLVSPSGGFLSLLFDQGLHFASIKLCLVLSRQGAIIKIPVVRCHCLWCLGAQYNFSGVSASFQWHLRVISAPSPWVLSVCYNHHQFIWMVNTTRRLWYPAVTYAAFQHQGRLFWITCNRPKLLRKAGCLQLIQNSALSMWHLSCREPVFQKMVQPSKELQCTS